MIAETAALADGGRTPGGVAVREVRDRIDFERIGEMEAAVWGNAKSGTPTRLEPELAADPDGLAIFVAEADRRRRLCRVGAVPERHRLRDLVGRRDPPRVARARHLPCARLPPRAARSSSGGRRYLEVDASAESRPILERLGFRAITQDEAVRLVALDLVASALRVRASPAPQRRRSRIARRSSPSVTTASSSQPSWRQVVSCCAHVSLPPSRVFTSYSGWDTAPKENAARRKASWSRGRGRTSAE